MGATRSTSLVIIPSTSGGSTVVGVIRSRAGGGSALFAQAPSVPAPATPRPASPAQRRASRRLGAGDVRVESRGQRGPTWHVNLYVLGGGGWGRGPVRAGAERAGTGHAQTGQPGPAEGIASARGRRCAGRIARATVHHVSCEPLCSRRGGLETFTLGA